MHFSYGREVEGEKINPFTHSSFYYKNSLRDIVCVTCVCKREKVNEGGYIPQERISGVISMV